MDNQKRKTLSYLKKKANDPIAKEPIWALIFSIIGLVASIISSVISAISYFTATNPRSDVFYSLIISGVNLVIFAIILIVVLKLRYNDSLLENEKILFVGQAPVWPAVICGFFIAITITCTVLPTVLFFLPADHAINSFLKIPSNLLIGIALVALVETIALFLVASLLLKPKFFLTNLRMIGHTRRIFRLPMYSSVFYSSITSIRIACWHHLCVGTQSGYLHFIFVRNAPEAYRLLVKKVAESRNDTMADGEAYDDYAYGYGSYYAPGYQPEYENPYPRFPRIRRAPIDFSTYRNGKPVKPKMPPKPRVPKFR